MIAVLIIDRIEVLTMDKLPTNAESWAEKSLIKVGSGERGQLAAYVNNKKK